MYRREKLTLSTHQRILYLIRTRFAHDTTDLIFILNDIVRGVHFYRLRVGAGYIRAPCTSDASRGYAKTATMARAESLIFEKLPIAK